MVRNLVINMVNIKYSRCGKERESLHEIKCKKCGGVFEVEIDFEFRKENLKDNFPYIREWVTLGEGNTPLIRRGKVWFKLDFLNPTGSYKDRGSVTLISYLASNGIKDIAEDSSGNAGASIAAYGKAAGMNVTIFVPETARGNKVKQIEAYGAKLMKVSGTRDDVTKAAEKSGYYYASHVFQPHFRDGIRSLAYEIVRDLNWKIPEKVFIPVSAGTLLMGVYSGFKHLMESGVIEKIPTIVAVQTKQVMPVCAKLNNLSYAPPAKVTSIADALVSTNPALLQEMTDVLQNYGECRVVDDNQITEAWKELTKIGLLVEYSSATVYASLRKDDENSVLVLTGNGLKVL